METASRLPGRSVKYFGWAAQRQQLWLTEEYLLSREIALFQEEVRRYYYRDIQAVVLGPSPSWKTCNWLAGSLLVFLSGCAVFAAALGSTPAYVFALFCAAAPLGILLGNLVLGPTCRVTLYTAAAEAPLYSLGRRRSAEKALNRLAPFIEAAQRDMAPPAGPETGAPDAAASAAEEVSSPPPPAPDPSGP
ncbi:MAG: hypothetical protein KF886_07715 [Candidatus Hydrogenedentes bacterium]|nr:hypothetical protein [Candidatus Hydrogenedentota bacterium]